MKRFQVNPLPKVFFMGHLGGGGGHTATATLSAV